MVRRELLANIEPKDLAGATEVLETLLALTDRGGCETLETNAHSAYGILDKDNVTFLVLPDGYVGLIASQNWLDALNEYRAAVVCVPL